MLKNNISDFAQDRGGASCPKKIKKIQIESEVAGARWANGGGRGSSEPGKPGEPGKGK